MTEIGLLKVPYCDIKYMLLSTWTDILNKEGHQDIGKQEFRRRLLAAEGEGGGVSEGGEDRCG